MPKLHLLLGACALLAACQGDSTAPAVQTGSTAPGPHDGQYSGPITLTGGTANCGGDGQVRTLVVAGNRARILYSPSNGRTANGMVTDAGAVQLSDVSQDVNITGQITNGRFDGQFVSRNCRFRFNFTKA